jgi:periplasmic protein TonB
MLFSTISMISARSRGVALLLLIAALAACSKQEEAPAAKPADAASQAAAPAAPPPPAVSAQVQAMNVEELRQSATNALRENRIYAPGGDNAMEYYLALRDKLPTDPGVTSALTDLMPYTLIAAEQSIAREEFDEALRLSALIEKTDPNAPALPRLKQSIATAQQTVAQRAAATEKNQAEQETRQQEQQRLAQQAEQQRAAEAQAAQQLAAQQEAAARAESERQAAQREAQQRAEREAAARNAATATTTSAAPAAASAATLRAVSTPAPRYPPDALRSGTSGEVLVEITVGTDGSVTAARVVRANPARVFDREALNAVRRWRFEPVDAPITTRRTIGFNPG